MWVEKQIEWSIKKPWGVKIEKKRWGVRRSGEEWEEGFEKKRVNGVLKKKGEWVCFVQVNGILKRKKGEGMNVLCFVKGARN